LRHLCFAAVGILVAMLAACTTEVPTDPQAFGLEPYSTRQLRASPHPVAVNNGYQTENKQEFKVSRQTLIVDVRQLTETGVDMLKRGLRQQGLAVAPRAEKTVTLRVVVRWVTVNHIPMALSLTRVRLMLEAQGADGTRAVVEAENQSPVSEQRAFDGAVLFALNHLLADEKFLAYMNR
jgi:hypothetical protein